MDSLLICSALVVFLTAACATTSQSRCSPSVLLNRVEGQLVYTDCAVNRQAGSSREQILNVYFTPSSEQSCYRAAIEVIVGPDGVPLEHTARIASSNDATFGQLALETVKSAKYRPAMKNGIAVHQLLLARMAQPRISSGCG